MYVPKPLPLSGIRHTHGRDYRAFDGIGSGALLPEKVGEFYKK